MNDFAKFCTSFSSGSILKPNILSCFVGDAVGIARTAIDEAPASCQAQYRLHSVLWVLLQAYLPPRAAKEWSLMCKAFVFPDNFAQGWTELVRMYDLQCAIAALTAAEVHYVKRLDTPSWGRFLQILEDEEDTSSRTGWIVAVL